jgi:dTDP-glucose 4,6-dehydratase
MISVINKPMNKKLKKLLYLVLNIFTWILASYFALFLRYDFSIPLPLLVKVIPITLILTCTFYAISYLDSKLFGMSRRNSIEEFFSILRRYLITGISLFVFLYLYPNFILPRSFPILTSILALGFFVIFTKVLKYLYQVILLRDKKILVGIYGAGQQGQLLIQKILTSNNLDWKPTIVFDDDRSIKFNKINGIKIVTGISLAELLEKYKLGILIISFSNYSNEQLQIIEETCEEYGVQLRVIPPIKALTGTDFNIKDIRKPSQEELIGKAPVQINLLSLHEFFVGKNVLITGAGGSIGSEIARQISNCRPKNLYLLDRDESGLLDVDISIESRELPTHRHILLADIRDQDRMIKIFSQVKPDIVFHAAALKHLNMLESHPDEGFKTNIQGTNNLLALTVGSSIRTFINISTDKAADPTSVLGKTKLIAEQLTAGYAQAEKKCKFVSVRFGNVFGSRGSVLHTFSRQIELGAPIVITDPKVERYFMTLEESVHLVLRAAVEGESGETLILKMGKPILIKKIAEKLIKASGKSIEIKFSSLRPGEKLSESLIGKKEVKLNTSDGQTLRIKVDSVAWQGVPKIWKDFLNSHVIDRSLE